MSEPPASELAVHGGDLRSVAREAGCEVRDLLDFSSNVNPLGPPASLLEELVRAAADTREVQRYPEPDSATLRERLARELDVGADAIVVANGAAALLEVGLVALAIRRCILPIPAFSEDARSLVARGIAVVELPLSEERDFRLDAGALVRAVASAGADGALLTNPHNPTGALASAGTMRRTIAEARDAGAAVLLDEAFVDFAPEASVARDAAGAPGLVVVRSLTKFYAVPALRVGYAVAHPHVARSMRALLPSWPAGSLETRALAAALGDRVYAARTREEVARERAWLVAALVARGFGVTPSRANFMLLRLRSADDDAPAFTRRLARASRVVVRDCSSYAGLTPGRYIRIAVRPRVENERLIAAIDAIGLAPA